MFLNLFKRNKPEFGFEKENVGDICLPEGAPIYSEPKGLFSMYINEDAMGLILEHGLLSRQEVNSLPRITYDKCKELGLLPRQAVHFILNHCDDVRTEAESCAAISKITPPIITDNGKAVARALVVFDQPFISDMNQAEKEMIERCMRDSGGTLKPNDLRDIKSAYKEERRTRCMTLLIHELVHLFVTDEFSGSFKDFDLASLELLTDSIAVQTLHLQVFRAENPFAEAGFIHGAAYISNQLRAELETPDRASLIQAMNTRSLEIIEEHKARLASESQFQGVAPKVKSDVIDSGVL